MVVILKAPQWSERWVYFNLHDFSQDHFDSVLLNSKGEGSITFRITDPQVLALSIDKKDFPLLVAAKPGEKITITYNNGWEVDGSLETSKILNFQERIKSAERYLKEFKGKIDAIDSTNILLKDSLIQVYRHTYDSVRNALQNEAYVLAASNPFDLTSAFIVNASFESEQLLPYGNYSQVYRKVDSCLNLLYPKKQLVLDYRRTIAYHRLNDSIARIENALRPGMIVPTIQYKTFNEKYFSIPGLWAKWILLYFWDYNSSESFINLRGLRNLYAKYNPVGLEIVSFGVNTDSLSLSKLTQTDTIGWYQVPLNDPFSMGKLQLYGIVHLPASVLIDKSGKVLAKNATIDIIRAKLDSLTNVTKPKPVVKPKADNISTNMPQ
ncbi:MAG: thioredoxin family protein [Bacteroidota bacterium]